MLTVLHGKEFYNRYIDTGFFDENSEQESCKVLSYSKKLSKVYYVTPEKEQGLILYFTKNENNIWEMSSWDCSGQNREQQMDSSGHTFGRMLFSNDTYYTGKAG